MAPSAPALALTLVFGIGGRSGDSLHVQSAFCARWASSTTADGAGSGCKSRTYRCCGTANPAAHSRRRPRPAPQGVPATAASMALAARQGEGEGGRGEENQSTEAEAEALRQRVFANEKGFLESTAFNPARARAKQEEEKAQILAAQWGSTPERVKEVMKKSSEKKDLSFQELERMADEMNLSDEQQRAFMLQASMKRLSSAMTIPKRAPPNRLKEAVNEWVFASEKGFMKNSKAFRSRMEVGSGVRFDSKGFPVLEEGDEVIQAAKRNASKREELAAESAVFPSLPDCPRCSTPTPEDELSRFGMCSQCKAMEISSKAYRGPQAASKYTYDTGDAPFSGSWAAFSAAERRPPNGRPEKTTGAVSPSPTPSASSSVDWRQKFPPAAAPSHPPRGFPPPLPRSSSSSSSSSSSPSPSRSFSSSSDGGVERTVVPAVIPNGNAGRSGDRGGSRMFSRVPADRTTTKTITTPSGGSSSDRGDSRGVDFDSTATQATRRGQGGGGGDSSVVTYATHGRAAEPKAEATVRKLSLEVAGLQRLLGETRAALARVERAGGSAAAATITGTAAEPRGTGDRSGSNRSSNSNDDGERRDATVRRLNQEVAELRRELSVVVDRVTGPTSTSLSARGGDREVVQTLSRQVKELHKQLESARKETAETRSALRRLQDDVAGLLAR